MAVQARPLAVLPGPLAVHKLAAVDMQGVPLPGVDTPGPFGAAHKPGARRVPLPVLAVSIPALVALRAALRARRVNLVAMQGRKARRVRRVAIAGALVVALAAQIRQAVPPVVAVALPFSKRPFERLACYKRPLLRYIAGWKFAAPRR